VFSFDTGGTQSLAAGPVEITFRNTGTMAHELRVIRVRDGNFGAYRAAVVAQGAAGSGPLGDDLGGPGAVEPGQSFTTTITLGAGSYALVCFLTDSDGKAFAQHGMIAELEVS
jgi:hypothetical protein